MEDRVNRDTSLAEKISLVIIARNRACAPESSLRKLLSLPERAPIIVVDNHSEDETLQMVRTKFSAVTLLPSQKTVAPPAEIEAWNVLARHTWPSLTTTRGGRTVRCAKRWPVLSNIPGWG